MANFPFRVARVYWGSRVAAGRFALSGLSRISRKAPKAQAIDRTRAIVDLWQRNAVPLLKGDYFRTQDCLRRELPRLRAGYATGQAALSCFACLPVLLGAGVLVRHVPTC